MMQPTVKISFRQEVLEIPLEQLVALKETEPRVVGTRKYKHIRASLEHIGLIEPLAVFPQAEGRFLVTNGNLRLHILKELRVTKARCTVALDDESYTYNKRVNALSPITEHFMILKAIANGVTEERIAIGLDIDVKAIRTRRRLLDGICPEAVELLKEKRVSSLTFGYLRKMKPLRQIEAAELMISGKNYTYSFAAAILGVSPREQLVKPKKEIDKGDDAHARSLIEETTDTLIGDLVIVRRTYGVDVLTLTVMSRCIENLIQNAQVERYLQHNHLEVLSELRHIVGQVNAEGASPVSTPGRDIPIHEPIRG
jgi:RepB plasmid partitioning protein/ParB-like nuclease domain